MGKNTRKVSRLCKNWENISLGSWKNTRGPDENTGSQQEDIELIQQYASDDAIKEILENENSDPEVDDLNVIMATEEALESYINPAFSGDSVIIDHPSKEAFDEVMDIERQAFEENWFDNDIACDDEKDNELEELKEKIIFSRIHTAKDPSCDEMLEIVSDKTIEEQASQMIPQEQQAVEEATPYIYGKQVMKRYKLRFLDVGNGDNMLSIFNGRFWQRLRDEELKQLAYNILPEDIKLVTKGVETLVSNIANYIKREMKKMYDNGKRRFTPEDYQAIENHIVFQNCVYDVMEGKQLPFTSKLPYSYAIECNYIEEDEDTPYYDKFKNDATGGDKESAKMFDYMQAYIIMPNRKGKCFFVMAYAKDSGKTSWGEFIEGYFSEELVQKMDVEHLGGKFSYAGMDQVRLISCLEMPVAKLTRSAVKALKNFTGESKFEVEEKYKNHITTKVRFKTLLASNGGVYLPPGYIDNAFYRRVIVIPFVHSTPLDKLIADLPQRWEKERSAIISKCVRAFGEIIAEDGGIVFPESQLSKEIKAGWSGKSMVNEKFIKEAFIFTGRGKDAIPKADVETEYNRYYFDNVFGNDVDRSMQCDIKELIKLIREIYPNIGESRLRRATLNNPEVTLQYCITGIAWSDGFGCRTEETG